jgi:hypothetical protein
VNEKAAADRFEEDKAVLLVGDAEERLIVDRAKLPPGAREGHWQSLEIRDRHASPS